MPFAIIGQQYTFHTLFVDGQNNPAVVNDPQIEVYVFDKEGNKASLVAAGTPLLPVQNSVGTYIYLWTVPPAWTYGVGQEVIAVMKGTDPNDLAVSISEETVTVTNSPVGWVGMKVGQAGIVPRFLK